MIVGGMCGLEVEGSRLMIEAAKCSPSCPILMYSDASGRFFIYTRHLSFSAITSSLTFNLSLCITRVPHDKCDSPRTLELSSSMRHQEGKTSTYSSRVLCSLVKYIKKSLLKWTNYAEELRVFQSAKKFAKKIYIYLLRTRSFPKYTKSAQKRIISTTRAGVEPAISRFEVSRLAIGPTGLVACFVNSF